MFEREADVAAHAPASPSLADHGRTPSGARKPPLKEPWVDTFVFWAEGQGTTLTLGQEHRLDLRAAADAATKLATVVERVRDRGRARPRPPSRTRRAGGERRDATQVRVAARAE